MSSAKKLKETIIWRYIDCSREGEKFLREDDKNGVVEESKRRRVSMRCGCNARVIFKYEAEYGYVVNLFEEGHNHPLIEAEHKRFMKLNRKIDAVHQEFILDCVKANIGPTQSHKLLNEMMGDMMELDVQQQMYCMIFAPLTGKDNHGRPVSFGAALLTKEDAESFSWLLQKFVMCMGTSPKMIITDQDLGMKATIERVLPQTRCRWCMWHIMLKVAHKVTKELQGDDDFKRDLNSYVWSELIEPEVFEEGWTNIMEKCGLEEDTWFTTMYEARKFWVPAFFRDCPMSGLMRTTSISECENNFFKTYTRALYNLLEFWMSFNHAIDAQRQTNAQHNYIDNVAIPSLDTTMSIENHATTIYTATILRCFQEELSGALFCYQILNMAADGQREEYKIQDEFDMQFNVVYKEEENECECHCKMYMRLGTLCRHMLFVYKNKRVKQIPEKYQCGRWKKLNLVDAVHGNTADEVEKFVGVQEGQVLKNKMVAAVFGWVQKIEGENQKLTDFLARMNEVG